MQMRVPSQAVREALYRDDHSGPRLLVLDRRGHELENGFVSGPGELGEELAVEKEVLCRLRDYAALRRPLECPLG